MADSMALEKLRLFFNSGQTLSYDFRKQQLLKLRSAILAHEQDLYTALSEDLGKNPEEVWATETGMVLAELNFAIRKLRNWMRDKRIATNLLNLPSRSRIVKEPLGVVLIIGPWNYPFQLLFNPLIGAIAAGNAVVLKPSEFAPATDRVMKKIIESTFDPAYILYVQGDGAIVIPGMMNSFTFNHVFYTGSTAVGKIIYKMAAEKLVPVTLELGGKSPCVVEQDANIKVAARRIAMTKFSNAGQMCVAPDYVLVHENVREIFLKELTNAIRSFYSEQPDENYNYGKIINVKQFERISQYLKEGDIVTGGRTDKQKLFIEPTVLQHVQPGSKVLQEEIFGPILPVIGFTEPQQALDVIRKNPDPLSFYIYTGSSRKEKEWINAVPAGGTCVNNSSWHLTNHHLPFGGRGNSGIGQYHGKFSFDTFSHQRAVMKTPTWFDPSIKYPPFKGRLGLFKKIIR